METYEKDGESFFKFNNMEIKLDDEGFIVNSSGWNTRQGWSRELSEFIAKDQGISELTDAHWQLIGIIREDYEIYRSTTTPKKLILEVREKLGPEKGCPRYIYGLFPGGILKQLTKIACLPKTRY